MGINIISWFTLEIGFENIRVPIKFSLNEKFFIFKLDFFKQKEILK